MALNSRVSNFKSYSWMLLLFFMLTVISSASIVPSLSDYMTKQRRQRRGDAWIAQALDSICPWAECQGWIGCTRISNQPMSCPPTPANFRELQPYEVKPMSRRRSLGTCYGYSPPGKLAPNDWCKDGPKKDECACINSDHILRIGYSEPGETHPQDDAPIGDLCASRITSPCTTTAAPPPTTTAALTTSFTTLISTTEGGPAEVSTTGILTTSTLTPSTTATTPTAMTTANPSATPVVPTGSSSSADDRPITGAPSVVTMSTPRNEEGSNGVKHFFIWPPLLVALILLCLLVALYRRRRRSSKIPAGVSVGFSAVNTSDSPKTPPPGDDVTVSNPSYERHVSGSELERSGDYFCPPLDTIPRTPNSGRGRSISPGHDGEVHGKNAAAVHGNFNVAFSEGNYNYVQPDPEGTSDEKLTSHVEYSNPVDIVPSTANRGSSSQPVSKLSADGYEDVPVFSFAEDSTDATSAYETATAYQQDGNHLQNYTTTDNPHPRGRNARPGADLHYEPVSPAGHSPKPTRDNVYAYATTVVHPAGLIVSDNQYNVLQTPVKENDGEYSMLKRSIGGSDSTSPHVPIVSSNEYNRIAIPLIKH